MLTQDLKQALRFYFITDDAAPGYSPVEQVKIAVTAGATMIQYRNKTFSPQSYEEVVAIRDICKSNRVPFVINDDILLAKAVTADGVHVGQDDENPAVARNILGYDAIVGTSVSTMEELDKTDLHPCDYIGTGPVYKTGTKADASPVIGLNGLNVVVKASPVPVVAIGGINESNAAACFEHGAAGVSLISAISRSKDPIKSARQLALICGCAARSDLSLPWQDEFMLISKLIKDSLTTPSASPWVIVPPGDDTSLLNTLTRPVITTDAQREGVHFSFSWQTPAEIGQKAVEITLSDLAASFAAPVCFFINLGLPSYISDQTVEALYAGITPALTKHNCALGGGNISGADQLSLDLFAIGQGRDDIFPARSAARIGDGLYCTGPLGMARAGLDSLVRKDTSFTKLVEKFKFPKARFDAANVLADHRVACVMDISDGLAGDAMHLAKASKISIQLELDPNRLEPDLVAYCHRYNLSAEEMAIAGGEDYELLFACRSEVFENIIKFLPEAYAVGKCLPFQESYIINPPKGASSFQHGLK